MKRALVVGAGPAGLAAAICAAESGDEAWVFERRRGALDKACGEGVVPSGVRWLTRHLVDVAGGRPFAGIRYIDERVTLDGRFSTPGLAFRRTDLSERLLARARALGVRVVTGASVDEPFADDRGVSISVDGERVAGDYGVAADGLHGTVGAWIRGPERRVDRLARYGLRVHAAVAPWTDRVEVHWSARGEAYVTPIDGGTVGVALLSRERPLRFDLSPFPRLQDALGDWSEASTMRGAGPLARPVRRLRRGRFGLVGDAAGYLDACTGEGISLAFATAEAWVRVASAGQERRYASAYRAAVTRYWVATSAVLALTRSRALRRAVFQGFKLAPPTFNFALGLVAG
ncbi:MAG: FAD-dependent monooxygenase [Myxococcota bacterium]